MDEYDVVIVNGAPQYEVVKTVGPFRSRDDAAQWLADEGYGTAPSTDEWALIVPSDNP